MFMVQAVTAAMGVLGVEGVFRVSAEGVLAALRANQDTLGMLLDAILLDPSVQWAPEREDSAARQDMDVAVSLSLLASRAEELQPLAAEQLRRLVAAINRATQASFSFADVHAWMAGARAAAAAAGARMQEAQVRRVLEAPASAALMPDLQCRLSGRLQEVLACT